MKFWVTKYALSSGIAEYDCDAPSKNGYIYPTGPWGGIKVGRDAWDNEERARAVAEKQRVKRLEALRKQIKEALANYITLAALRMTEYVENVDFDTRKGMPFSGHNTNFSQRQAVTEMLKGEATQVMLNVFFQEIGQEVFDVLASKRGYAQKNFRMVSYWGKSAGHQPDRYDQLEKQITQKEFEQALLKRCIKLADAHRPSERQELPQFMRKEDYPRTNIHV